MMSELTLRNPHLEGESFYWPGGATGVLLIHGFTATTAEVRPLGQYLYARGYTVAGPLLPGHRTTPQDLNRCRWQDWAGAVELAYRDMAARCQRVFVGGESMGAVLALYAASEHPEIAGVLAYAPALLTPARRMWLASLLKTFVPYVKKPVHPPRASDERWQGYPVNPLRAAAQLNLLQREARRCLSRIHQPVLVVQGRLDAAIDPRSGEVILRETACTVKELHWLERSAHCVVLDQEWEQAAEWTLQFIELV
jgi:carboxylesterase